MPDDFVKYTADDITDDDIDIAKEIFELPEGIADDDVKNVILNMGYINFLDLVASVDNIDASKSVNVNDDKDDDIVALDTDSDGDVDTAFVTAQSKKERKDAINKAKDMLSTGNEEKDNTDKITDSAIPTNDTMHNVIDALKDLRF